MEDVSKEICNFCVNDKCENCITRKEQNGIITTKMNNYVRKELPKKIYEEYIKNVFINENNETTAFVIENTPSYMIHRLRHIYNYVKKVKLS